MCPMYGGITALIRFQASTLPKILLPLICRNSVYRYRVTSLLSFGTIGLVRQIWRIIRFKNSKQTRRTIFFEDEQSISKVFKNDNRFLSFLQHSAEIETATRNPLPNTLTGLRLHFVLLFSALYTPFEMKIHETNFEAGSFSRVEWSAFYDFRRAVAIITVNKAYIA